MNAPWRAERVKVEIKTVPLYIAEYSLFRVPDAQWRLSQTNPYAGYTARALSREPLTGLNYINPIIKIEISFAVFQIFCV